MRNKGQQLSGYCNQDCGKYDSKSHNQDTNRDDHRCGYPLTDNEKEKDEDKEKITYRDGNSRKLVK